MTSTEERQARRVELQDLMDKEWRRFRIIVSTVTVIAAGGLALLYTVDVISYGVMVALLIVAFCGLVAYGLYALFTRLLPLDREIKAIGPKW